MVDFFVSMIKNSLTFLRDYIIVVLSGILVIQNSYLFFKKIFIKWHEKHVNKHYTYENDTFAHDTIRYRFRDILYTLNNFYEDTVLSLYSNSLSDQELREKVKERPFDYKKLMKSDFCQPNNLFKFLDINSKQILIEFYSKFDIKCTYGYLFSNYPFIDVEHVFYFYILDVFYGLDEAIQKEMSNNIIENGIPDPYKKRKENAIIKDLNKGLPLRNLHTGEDIDDILVELENDHNCSAILKCLNIIIVLERIIKEQEKKGIDWGRIKRVLEIITFLSLESNTNDLSQLSDGTRKPMDKNHVYPNNLESFAKYIKNLEEETTVNYLVDNSGVEYFTDITFSYIMIRVSSINKVILHINKLPVFVSDVIESDYSHMMNLVDNFLESKNMPQVYRDALELMKRKINEDEINITEDIINITSNFIWNMPTPYNELAKKKTGIFTAMNSVLIIKGDLNYRRLVEDKDWYYKEKISKFTKKYINCPTLVVRSIKSDLIIDFYGDGKRKKNNWEKEDQYWRENGEYGVIRFINKEQSKWKRLLSIFFQGE